MDKDTLKSLKNIIDYLYYNEQKHYEADRVDNHIFLDIKKLEKYINKIKKNDLK